MIFCLLISQKFLFDEGGHYIRNLVVENDGKSELLEKFYVGETVFYRLPDHRLLRGFCIFLKILKLLTLQNHINYSSACPIMISVNYKRKT